MITIENIEEKIINKEILNNEEVDVVVSFINDTDDLIAAMHLYSKIQRNTKSLVKIHPKVWQRIVDIVTMSDNFIMDESFFEKWFEHHMKGHTQNEFPLQCHIETTERINSGTNNLKNYLVWLKAKPNDYIVPEHRIEYNKKHNIPTT